MLSVMRLKRVRWDVLLVLLCTERPHGRLAVQFTVLLHKNSLQYETIPVHPIEEGLGFVQSWFNKQDARAGKGGAFALASACTRAAEWHESMSSCCDLVLCVLTQSRIKDFFSRGVDAVPKLHGYGA